eukprot:6231817-Prymnesium_polylepis.1
MTDAPESTAASILTDPHADLRRAQRLISKKDCRAALKHGTREESFNQRGEMCWKYKFADVVYIVKGDLSGEVTCWAAPGAGLDVAKHQITPALEAAHARACSRMQEDTASWTSHT